jgi:hypothetical protein
MVARSVLVVDAGATVSVASAEPVPAFKTRALLSLAI